MSFLRCISQSRGIKQTWKVDLKKILDIVVMETNYNVTIYLQIFYIPLTTCSLDQAKNVLGSILGASTHSWVRNRREKGAIKHGEGVPKKKLKVDKRSLQ